MHLIHKAGVALVIKKTVYGYQLLLIKRSTKIKDPWSGHIAFPGGHYEEKDSSIFNTVIRETKEETGIDLLKSAEYLYPLPSSSPLNMPELDVYPFVFKLSRDVDIKCDEEVEEYYWVPINSLKKEKNWVEFEGFKKKVESYVYIFDKKKIVIWGLTKRILDKLLSKLNKNF